MQAITTRPIQFGWNNPTTKVRIPVGEWAEGTVVAVRRITSLDYFGEAQYEVRVYGTDKTAIVNRSAFEVQA